MDRHVTLTELEGFLYGGLSFDRSRDVLAHLLSVCPPCCKALTAYLALVFGEGSAFESPAAGEGMPQISAFRSVEERKREALAFLSSLGLGGLEAAPYDVQGVPLFEALLERSWALRDENPDEMVELARCAALLADRLRETELGSKPVADLRCRAWVELANAYGVAGELDQADAALEQATGHFVVGSLDDLLAARFFTVLASQYAARGSFRLACSTLDAVVEIYRRHGDRHQVGRALIRKGIFTGCQGNAEGAVRLIETGVSSVEEQRDPELVSSALQNVAWYLAECGRFREARRMLWVFRRRFPDAGGRLNALRVRWLEAHIFVGLEDFGRAEQALRHVKEGLVEAGLPFKAALAGLELGALLLRQDRVEEATERVLEGTGLFLSLRVDREALATVLLLQEAGKRRRLNLAVLDAGIAVLRKREREPSVPFPLAAAG